jgi:hypothetical protein
MITRGKGYKPDPAGHQKTPFIHLARRRGMTALGSTPAHASLEALAPAVFDQGPTGSCTGHAVACAIKAALGSALSWVPSPGGIYRLGRCVDRVSLSEKLTDDGAAPNAVVRGAREWGIHPMVALADRYSDADPATINAEPTLFELEVDATALVLNPYAILSTGAQRVAELRVALSSGFPATIAIEADGDAFQGYEDGVLESLGRDLDHYVAVIGYETLRDR